MKELKMILQRSEIQDYILDPMEELTGYSKKILCILEQQLPFWVATWKTPMAGIFLMP